MCGRARPVTRQEPHVSEEHVLRDDLYDMSDANAALTDAEHNATLNNMCALFADVMSTDEVIGALALCQHAQRTGG